MNDFEIEEWFRLEKELAQSKAREAHAWQLVKELREQADGLAAELARERSVRIGNQSIDDW